MSKGSFQILLVKANLVKKPDSMYLPSIEYPWDDTSIDFVLGPPHPKPGKNSIFEVVDQFSKMTHILAYHQTDGASHIANMFFRESVRMHSSLHMCERVISSFCFVHLQNHLLRIDIHCSQHHICIIDVFVYSIVHVDHLLHIGSVIFILLHLGKVSSILHIGSLLHYVGSLFSDLHIGRLVSDFYSVAISDLHFAFKSIVRNVIFLTYVLRAFSVKIIVVCCDDVFVYCKSHDDHMHHLRNFAELRKERLYSNCVFCHEQVTFLGFVEVSLAKDKSRPNLHGWPPPMLERHGELMRLRKERFPTEGKSKLAARADVLFQQDHQGKCQFFTVFGFTDPISFILIDSRTNPFQPGGDDAIHDADHDELLKDSVHGSEVDSVSVHGSEVDSVSVHGVQEHSEDGLELKGGVLDKEEMDFDGPNTRGRLRKIQNKLMGLTLHDKLICCNLIQVGDFPTCKPTHEEPFIYNIRQAHLECKKPKEAAENVLHMQQPCSPCANLENSYFELD